LTSNITTTVVSTSVSRVTTERTVVFNPTAGSGAAAEVQDQEQNSQTRVGTRNFRPSDDPQELVN
jgi:hypothetical protein